MSRPKKKHPIRNALLVFVAGFAIIVGAFYNDDSPSKSDTDNEINDIVSTEDTTKSHVQAPVLPENLTKPPQTKTNGTETSISVSETTPPETEPSATETQPKETEAPAPETHAPETDPPLIETQSPETEPLTPETETTIIETNPPIIETQPPETEPIPDETNTIVETYHVQTEAPDTTTEQPASGTDYVLNTNTMKFHYPYCSSVKRMSEKNKAFFNGTRDEVIDMGYDPCQNCNP